MGFEWVTFRSTNLILGGFGKLKRDKSEKITWINGGVFDLGGRENKQLTLT